MTQDLSQRLQNLAADADRGLFNGIRRGLEKETLRTTPDGNISQGQHPAALGSALTHPHITTDYSEALLEFITPVSCSRSSTLDFLLDLHRYSLQRLEQQELLWPASMPCRLQGNPSIRIAEYGASNVGQMKHVYRHGLDWRYGRIMQSIAGLHYNLSFPDALWPRLAELEDLPASATDDAWRSARYFGLIRNFRRHSWLLMYLFGASPTLDQSFLDGRTDHPLQRLTDDALGSPQATSLRMSDLGYRNKVQASLKVCLNSLENYIQNLGQAVRTPHPAYEAIGVKVDGVYRQLNVNLLQIENEYYSSIRPKRVTRSGQKPTEALQEKGVEYIEVRCLDINPFLPGGIDVPQMHFIDAFLLYCLLQDSPPISDDECRIIDGHLASTINAGRAANTRINGKPLQQAANELLAAIHPVCQLLDRGTPEETPFCSALEQQQSRVDDPSLTPSARMLQLVQECGGHVAAVLELARAQREQLLANPLNKAREAQFEALSRQSLQQQQELEAADQVDFDSYLEQYFAS